MQKDNASAKAQEAKVVAETKAKTTVGVGNTESQAKTVVGVGNNQNQPKIAVAETNKTFSLPIG